jgi:S1-C subfamily serine protease
VKARNDATAIMVVLVGSGHVAYGVGIERQARRWIGGAVTTLVPVPIEDDKGVPITQARASYAHVVYGIAGERHSAYPSLGVSSMPAEGGRSIIDVQKDTPAAAVGLAVGDVIVTFDGQPVTSRETFSRLMAGKLWGDVVRLGITRGGQATTIDVPLRRAAKRPA